MTAPQFIGRAVVIKLTGLRGAELDRKIERREFPAPSIDGGRERWTRAEVLEWRSE